MYRGAVLTVEHRGNQFAWTVEIDSHMVSEGVSPSMDGAQAAAADGAVDAAGGG